LQLEKNLRGFSLSLGLTSDQFGANVSLSMPDFNTQVTVNYQPLTANPSTSGTTLTLGANIPVWDGGTTDAARESAIIGIENAQSQLEQVRQDTRYQLESAIELARLDAQNLLLQQEAKTVAEGSLNEVKQRLALGAVSPLDELAARAGLEAAQGNLLAAQTRMLEDLYWEAYETDSLVDRTRLASLNGHLSTGWDGFIEPARQVSTGIDRANCGC
jgi:outer membrane protein TolC